MDDCELPENNICEIELDLEEYGVYKGVYGPNGNLYFIWPYKHEPPFTFEYDEETGDLYFKMEA